MSSALINRSLTTVRTELEFLYESEVITKELYEKVLKSLPNKYEKGMTAWGIDKLEANADISGKSSIEAVTDNLSSTSIGGDSKRGPDPERKDAGVLGYCKANYDYVASQPEDLDLRKNDMIAIVEHLSEDWWKGYRKNDPSRLGVFPSNYVSNISEGEYQGGGDEKSFSRIAAERPYGDEKLQPQSSGSFNAPPGYYPSGGQQYPPPQMQSMQMQQSYGNYAQYPPPSTNYYPQQQYVQPFQQEQPVQQQQQPQQHSEFRKFGSKLGNAAIFGAGATLGSDLVNSIL